MKIVVCLIIIVIIIVVIIVIIIIFIEIRLHITIGKIIKFICLGNTLANNLVTVEPIGYKKG